MDSDDLPQVLHPSVPRPQCVTSEPGLGRHNYTVSCRPIFHEECSRVEEGQVFCDGFKCAHAPIKRQTSIADESLQDVDEVPWPQLALALIVNPHTI